MSLRRIFGLESLDPQTGRSLLPLEAHVAAMRTIGPQSGRGNSAGWEPYLYRGNLQLVWDNGMHYESFVWDRQTNQWHELHGNLNEPPPWHGEEGEAIRRIERRRQPGTGTAV